MRPSSWSELLPELAGLILRLLLCHIDRLRFRCVCRRWRLAERQHRPRLPPALPFICLNHRAFLSVPGGEARRAAAAPPDLTVRGCFDGWLLYGPRDRHIGDLGGGRCFLTNPLTGATVEMPLLLGDRGRSSVLFMRKAIVCSPDLVVAFLGGSTVAFHRRGAPSWSVCPEYDAGDGRLRPSYMDVALYRGKIYALDTDDDLFVHEIVVSDDDDGAAAAASIAGAPPDPAAAAAASRPVEQAIKAREGPRAVDPEEVLIRRCHYLVVSSTGNKLFMVKWTVPPFHRRSSPTSTDEFTVEVFEADLEMGRWVEVSSLDDDNGEALFVGNGCSKAVRFTGNDDERFQGNRVYVLGHDNFFGYCCNAMPSYGFYDLRSGRIGQVRHDRIQVAVWPISNMEWFFPIE